MVQYPEVWERSSSSVPVNEVVTVGTDSTELAPAADSDVFVRSILLVNTDASVTCYIGIGEAATTAMFPLLAGAGIELDTLLAVNGICASGDATIAVVVSEKG